MNDTVMSRLDHRVGGVIRIGGFQVLPVRAHVSKFRCLDEIDYRYMEDSGILSCRYIVLCSCA